MRQLFASCRPLRFIALALCSASIFVFVAPASARPYHGAGRHARAYHAGHHAKWHHTHRHLRHAARVSHRDRSVARMQARGLANSYAGVIPNPVDAASSGAFGSSDTVTGARPRHRQTQRPRQLRRAVRASNWDRGVAKMRAGGFADTNASFSPNAGIDPNSTLTPPGGVMGPVITSTSSNVVAEARRYLGGNPTGRGSVVRVVDEHGFAAFRLSRHRLGSGAFVRLSYGQRVSGPQVGADRRAYPGRRGGGRFGIVSGIDAGGNPIVVSGNNGNRVREAPIFPAAHLLLRDADELTGRGCVAAGPHHLSPVLYGERSPRLCTAGEGGARRSPHTQYPHAEEPLAPTL